MRAGTGKDAAHRGETFIGAGNGSTNGTTNPAEILSKPKSIDDIRARLAGVGLSELDARRPCSCLETVASVFCEQIPAATELLTLFFFSCVPSQHVSFCWWFSASALMVQVVDNFIG